MPHSRPFGKVLRELRKAAGISQEELAHQAGFDRTYIGRLERAICEPTLSTIQALAKTLKIRPSEMLARMERQP